MAGSGKLTTHVLDTMHGTPAAGMRIDLLHSHGDHTHHLATATTNMDGRLDQPLLDGEKFDAGTYIILFEVGPYFSRKGVEGSFLSTVPVQFTVEDAKAHYHIPLLVSPFAYSTYRGS
jgi:5-hydroxyisourate hydrolase